MRDIVEQRTFRVHERAGAGNIGATPARQLAKVVVSITPFHRDAENPEL
jgi:hypothetical protein